MFEILLSRSGLSFDRLKNFLAVVEAGSISKACEGDPVRQSLFSRQIRELEEFFGTQLTVRKGKGISISPAGHRLAILVREQLQGLTDFQREQTSLPKRFTFGAGASVLDWLLIPCLAELATCLGGSHLRLESHRSNALVDAVRDGEVDFAIMREDAIPQTGPYIPLGRITFWLCIGKNLPRIGNVRMPTNWNQLTLAIPATGGSFHTALSNACTEAGITLQPAVECQSFLQVKRLVEAGSHAGILPSMGLSNLAEAGASVHLFPLLEGYGRDLCLHWNNRQIKRRYIAASTLEALAHRLKRSFKAATRV